MPPDGTLFQRNNLHALRSDIEKGGLAGVNEHGFSSGDCALGSRDQAMKRIPGQDPFFTEELVRLPSFGRLAIHGLEHCSLVYLYSNLLLIQPCSDRFD